MIERMPWTLEGVEPEAREAAKLAAKRAGLPLGTWISQTLMTAAATELKRGSVPSAAQGASGNHQPPALTTEMLLDSIRRLSQRIESAEQRATETIAPLAEKMANLSERVEEVSARANISTAPMERALARMAERLEKLEHNPGGARDDTAPRRRFRLL